MAKMIEVPEAYLLELKKWRQAHVIGDYLKYTTFLDALDTLLECMPKQIEVGNRVRMPNGTVVTVLAINGDEMWAQYATGDSGIWRFKNLEVVE